MGYSNKLCNPTPWDTSWDYTRGIVLTIPAFGELQLENIQMVDDFRPDKAGAEVVQLNMALLGFFLYDPNRSYDVQALECVRKMKEQLSERFKASSQNIRNQMAAANMPVDGEPFEEILRQHRLDVIRSKITVLGELEKQYSDAVLEVGEAIQERGFDPERTIFAANPPREFPSKAAMVAYLNLPENLEIKEAHEAYQARLKAATKPKRVATDEKTVSA